MVFNVKSAHFKVTNMVFTIERIYFNTETVHFNVGSIGNNETRYNILVKNIYFIVENKIIFNIILKYLL